MFGHKNIIIAVGTDSACFPEIDYGNFRKLTMRMPTVVSMKLADLICPVHASMENYEYTYWDVRYRRQGFKAFIPSLTTPVYPIENGFDSKKWSAVKPYADRKFDAIAVFVVGAANRSVLKGADLVLAISKRNPDLRFKIIGGVVAGAEVPENCTVVSNCSQSELGDHYNDAKLFLQPSITEGFPNTLGEAMACGCFPIGSRVSSIPEIIGAHGFVLNRRDDYELEGLIRDALQRIATETVNMQEISDSIFSRYSMERRAQRLLQAIERVT
ncbi:MAG: glycosyltransferase family 4 protein [Bacteroidota bacterium]|nr:glycosyltransferase family 4 protein [Bacteroidota bacterium]